MQRTKEIQVFLVPTKRIFWHQYLLMALSSFLRDCRQPCTARWIYENFHSTCNNAKLFSKVGCIMDLMSVYTGNQNLQSQWALTKSVNLLPFFVRNNEWEFSAYYRVRPHQNLYQWNIDQCGFKWSSTWSFCRKLFFTKLYCCTCSSDGLLPYWLFPPIDDDCFNIVGVILASSWSNSSTCHVGLHHYVGKIFLNFKVN